MITGEAAQRSEGNSTRDSTTVRHRKLRRFDSIEPASPRASGPAAAGNASRRFARIARALSVLHGRRGSFVRAVPFLDMMPPRAVLLRSLAQGASSGASVREAVERDVLSPFRDLFYSARNGAFTVHQLPWPHAAGKGGPSLCLEDRPYGQLARRACCRGRFPNANSARNRHKPVALCVQRAFLHRHISGGARNAGAVRVGEKKGGRIHPRGRSRSGPPIGLLKNPSRTQLVN